MALRVATMSPIGNSSSVGKPRHLSRKLTLLFFLTSAYALGLVLLLQQGIKLPVIVFSYFADCTLAVIAGFGSRLVLTKRNWFIRSASAMIMVSTGQVILGYFSQWKIGLDVPLLLRGYLSWTDLGHLTLGIMASLSALWAWRKRRSESETVDAPTPAPAVLPYSNPTYSVRPRIRLPQSWSLNLGAMVRPGIGTYSGNGNGSSVRARPRLIANQEVKPKRKKISRHRPQVQLALIEEHRCPYCLEPVLRSDPRGVKECKVCHSLHHADCWQITGSCQVPHLNS